MDQCSRRQSSGNHYHWTEKRKRMIRTEDSLRKLEDNVKCTNICIVGASEGEEREKENIWKDKSWKFP